MRVVDETDLSCVVVGVVHNVYGNQHGSDVAHKESANPQARSWGRRRRESHSTQTNTRHRAERGYGVVSADESNRAQETEIPSSVGGRGSRG